MSKGLIDDGRTAAYFGNEMHPAPQQVDTFIEPSSTKHWLGIIACVVVSVVALSGVLLMFLGACLNS